MMPLVLTGLVAPMTLTFSSTVRVYNRAKQLLIEAHQLPGNATPAPAVEPFVGAIPWMNALGVVLVMTVLATGAWLQWGLR